MGNIIHANLDALALRQMSKAVAAIDEAVNSLGRAKKVVSGFDLYLDLDYFDAFALSGSRSELERIYYVLAERKEKLHSLANLLSSGPERLIEAEKNLHYRYYDKSNSFLYSFTRPVEVILNLLGINGAFVNANPISKSQNSTSAKVVEEHRIERHSFSITESVHPYSDGVTKGEIRYVDQAPNYASSNGWGKYGAGSGGECNTACQSMALSYLGIDMSPEQLLDTGRSMECGDTTSEPAVAAAGVDAEDVDRKLDAFISDNGQGNVSPVLIRYGVHTGNWWPGHWVMLVGKNADGSYQALGPWGEGSTLREFDNVRIENGMITTEHHVLSHLEAPDATWPVHAYTQYTLQY